MAALIVFSLPSFSRRINYERLLKLQTQEANALSVIPTSFPSKIRHSRSSSDICSPSPFYHCRSVIRCSTQERDAYNARKFCDMMSQRLIPRGGFLAIESQFGTSTNVSLNIFCGASRPLPNCTLPMVVTTRLIRPPFFSTLLLSWMLSGAPYCDEGLMTCASRDSIS